MLLARSPRTRVPRERTARGVVPGCGKRCRAVLLGGVACLRDAACFLVFCFLFFGSDVSFTVCWSPSFACQDSPRPLSMFAEWFVCASWRWLARARERRLGWDHVEEFMSDPHKRIISRICGTACMARIVTVTRTYIHADRTLIWRTVGLSTRLSGSYRASSVVHHV